MTEELCGKKPYPSADAARKASLAFSGKRRCRMHFYHCARCGAWHLSSADQARVKRIKRGAE